MPPLDLALMKQYFNRIIEIIKKIAPFTFPMKLVIGYLITALGSASVIGFLSEFATYTYAVDNGFRLPVEGIPYLKPTISFISLIIIFTSTFAFALAYIFVRTSAFILNSPEYIIKIPINIAKRILKHDSDIKLNIQETLNDVGATKALIITMIASSLATGMLYYLFKGTNISNHWWLYCLFFIAIFSTYLSAFNKLYVKYIASIISVLSVIAVIALMFNPSVYSKFLFATGFGGEIPTTLYTDSEAEKTISGNLLIKSNETYFLKNIDNSIIEYPTKNVIKVVYKK